MFVSVRSLLWAVPIIIAYTEHSSSLTNWNKCGLDVPGPSHTQTNTEINSEVESSVSELPGRRGDPAVI